MKPPSPPSARHKACCASSPAELFTSGPRTDTSTFRSTCTTDGSGLFSWCGGERENFLMTFVDQVKAATGSVRQIRKFWTDRAEWEAELAVDFKNQSLRPNDPGFQTAASVYTKLTKAATRFGENLLALEIAVEGRRTLLGPFDELYPEITERE